MNENETVHEVAAKDTEIARIKSKCDEYDSLWELTQHFKKNL